MCQTGSICVLNTRFEHWICSSGSTGKHTRSVLFGNADLLNLQFDMLDLNTGFALRSSTDEHKYSFLHAAQLNFQLDKDKVRGNTLARCVLRL